MGHVLALCLIFISIFSTMISVKVSPFFNPENIVLGPPFPGHSQTDTRPDPSNPTSPTTPTFPTEEIPFDPIPETEIIPLFTGDALLDLPEPLRKETKDQLLRELDAVLKKKKYFDKKDKTIIRTSMERVMESYPTYQTLYSFFDVPDGETFLREYFIEPLHRVDDMGTYQSPSYIIHQIIKFEEPESEDMQAAAVMNGLWSALVKKENPFKEKALYKAFLYSGASHMQTILAGSDYYPDMGSVSKKAVEFSDPLKGHRGYSLVFSDSGELYPHWKATSAWLWHRLFTLTDFETMTLFLQPNGEKLLKQALIDRYGDDGKEFYKHLSACAQKNYPVDEFTSHMEMEKVYLRLLAGRLQEVESPQEMLAFLQMYRVTRLGMGSEYKIDCGFDDNERMETIVHPQLDYHSVDLAVAEAVYDWHILNSEGLTEEQERALAYSISAFPSNMGESEYKITYDSVDSEPLICTDYRYSMKMEERDNIWFYFKYSAGDEERSVLRNYYFTAGKCYNFDHGAVTPPQQEQNPSDNPPQDNDQEIPSQADAIPLFNREALSNVPAEMSQTAKDSLLRELEALLKEKNFGEEAETFIRKSMECVLDNYITFQKMYSYLGVPNGATYLRKYFLEPLRSVRYIDFFDDSSGQSIGSSKFNEYSMSLYLYNNDKDFSFFSDMNASVLVNLLWRVAVACGNPSSDSKGSEYEQLRDASAAHMELVLSGGIHTSRMFDMGFGGPSKSDPSNEGCEISFPSVASYVYSKGALWSWHRLFTLTDFNTMALIMEPDGEKRVKEELIRHYGNDGKEFYQLIRPLFERFDSQDPFGWIVKTEALYLRLLKSRLQDIKSPQEMLTFLQMYRIVRLGMSSEYTRGPLESREMVPNSKLDYYAVDRAVAEAVAQWGILNTDGLTEEQAYALAYALSAYPNNAGVEEYRLTRDSLDSEPLHCMNYKYSMKTVDEENVSFHFFYSLDEKSEFVYRNYNFTTGECYCFKE